ncbi:MAG TPA: DUF3106 domain-containing protein [Burkholderiales bacterium]|nr:DUF3106 domain-containing protein [Burkholderiales bacterium]
MVKALQLHALAPIAFAFSLIVGMPAAQADNPGDSWSGLTSEQKTILAPLQPEWDKLDPERRKRWIGLAARYPSLSPERQQNIQQRMHEWVSLTPEQRTQAIERYKRIKQMPPERHDQLHQRWREYQALPEEQRQKLRESHGASPGAGK